MKTKAKSKIILTLSSIALLSITLVSTTYAYTVLSADSDVREFNFNVEGSLGLLVSLDGTNFSQDISSDMLKEKIAGSVEDYNDLYLTGVALKHTDGLFTYNLDNSLKFERDEVTRDETGRGTHSLVEGENNSDYISFDLYFKALNTNNTNPLSLSLVEGEDIDGIHVQYTYIKSKTSEVEISNSLTILVDGEMKTFNAGDKLTINSANAMRLAITTISEENKTQVFEVTDSNDLGSSAVEDYSSHSDLSIKNNKETNAMYTYYNNLYPLYPFTSAAEYGEGYNTIKTYDQVITNFTYENDNYNVIHTKVYLYLDGWDSDYIVGIPNELSKFDVSLRFEVKETL